MEGITDKATYKRIYEKFSVIFMDNFLELKSDGFSTQDAIQGAQMMLQDRVAKIIVESKKDTLLVVIKAYTNIKNDSEVVKKAIRYYQCMNSS